MRKILFRGKRFDGVWEFGYYFAKPILEQHFILHGADQWAVDILTIGQYTGMKDKTGQRIFEGDFIRYDTPNGIPHDTYLVRWDGDGFTTKPDSLDIVCSWPKLESKTMAHFNVVGNIYDNPELLNNAKA